MLIAGSGDITDQYTRVMFELLLTLNDITKVHTVSSTYAITSIELLRKYSLW